MYLIGVDPLLVVSSYTEALEAHERPEADGKNSFKTTAMSFRTWGRVRFEEQVFYCWRYPRNKPISTDRGLSPLTLNGL